MAETPNAIDVLVGGNARYWRVERGMTTLYVSSALGVSRDTFEAMEAGAARFGVNELRKLCDLLRIRPKAFYVEGDLRPAG